MHYFMDALKHKYADFNGRARRAEYWWFAVIYMIAFGALVVLDVVIGLIVGGFYFPIFSVVYVLGTALPWIAVNIRRLHDTGRSGILVLVGMIPCIGLILLVWLFEDSQTGTNDFGPNPKGE